eukprot:TRINITY_DN5920_c0_g1_i1.p1 TRINITY_DN5920_c0_g1~~TRINITY_DN5920_c0_g1_i1.p1  ORF type:complete len:209 (-),score=27.69 TRINITY_DN5920_c0_g1_i1:320-946(-)
MASSVAQPTRIAQNLCQGKNAIRAASFVRYPPRPSILKRPVCRATSSPSSASAAADPLPVPRICNLREFSESAAQQSAGLTRDLAAEDMPLSSLIMATVEAGAQAKDFETLSGRLAMIGFATALSCELITVNSVFTGLDVQGLRNILLLSFLAAAGVGGFAFAWRSKRHVADVLSSSTRSFLDSTLDSVIEGAFFDEWEATPWRPSRK